MRRIAIALAALVAVPVLAAPAQGPGGRPADPEARFERMERRLRFARAMGLAEALELDVPEAARLNETMSRFEEKSRILMRQVHDQMQVLRRAAGGDAAAQGQVDEAVRRASEARAQLAGLERDMFEAVSKGLSPEKRARAALFLARFQGRFGVGMGHGMGMGREGPGRGAGPGPGMWRGMGMGPGMGRGDGPGPGGWDCPDDCPRR